MVGYGVTDNPNKRILDYMHLSGGEQEFCYLWYSPTFRAKSLEDVVKQMTGSDTHKINGQYVEWISPKSNLTVESLKGMIEEIIDNEKLDVRPIKAEYLPFDNSPYHKKITPREINNNPSKYLDS